MRKGKACWHGTWALLGLAVHFVDGYETGVWAAQCIVDANTLPAKHLLSVYVGTNAPPLMSS